MADGAFVFPLIILPMILFGVFNFIFQGNTQAIQLEQLRVNCPWPVNSGVATLYAVQDNPVQPQYQISRDNDTVQYHVTIFSCFDANINSTGHRTGPITPSVITKVYTADVSNAWFAMTNRSSGFMFYISESITEFFQKADAVGHLIYLYLVTPAQISGIAWFAYVNSILIGWVILGIIMVARG